MDIVIASIAGIVNVQSDQMGAEDQDLVQRHSFTVTHVVDLELSQIWSDEGQKRKEVGDISHISVD